VSARPIRRWTRAHLALPLLLTLAGLGCEGSGDAGDGFVVELGPPSPGCAKVAGDFPSGFTLNPGDVSRAALVQFNPPAVLIFGLDAEDPVKLAEGGIPPEDPDSDMVDSDMDGVDDAERSQQEGFFPLYPQMGGIHAVDADLGLVSASNYEEVLFVDLNSAEQVAVLVENPVASGSFDPGHYPFLPPAGESHLRTAVSTRACVFPTNPFDSLGDAIPVETRCDPAVPGYFTNLTGGTARAAGRLFVATSNLRSSARAAFYPGTVLVYAWDELGGVPRVRPDVATPLLFTTGFNPTALTRYVTPSGRELVLVTVVGAIGAGTGGSNLRTEAAIDVIDAASLRVAASIPLGLAGPSFEPLAIDPGGRVALLGASSQRQLYAVDLAPLDDPRLYEGGGAPVLLDGLTAGFPDARIFHADRPLVLPDRSDGPADTQCEGVTHTAINAAGIEAFATDHCDGTLTRIRLSLGESPPIPVPPESFQVFRQDDLAAPLTAASIGLDRAPGPLQVRAGIPVLDYEGPDVFYTLGLPVGQFCGVRVNAP
jgi:hypothetical protein